MKIDVVIPVYNEAHVLEKKIRELYDFLNKNCTIDWCIVIANNASTDSTKEEMETLSSQYKRVKSIHIDKKGRGRALKQAWLNTDSDFVCYMDVDLSTGLDAFLKMVDDFKNGAHIVVGSRLLKDSKIERCLQREILSRGYNFLIKLLFNIGFSDAQCGFKGLSKKAIKKIIPFTKNKEWFFDTELLLLGAKLKYKIHEIPVQWVEDNDSRVKITSTVIEDIRGLLRMRKMFWFDKSLNSQKRIKTTGDSDEGIAGQA